MQSSSLSMALYFWQWIRVLVNLHWLFCIKAFLRLKENPLLDSFILKGQMIEKQNCKIYTSFSKGVWCFRMYRTLHTLLLTFLKQWHQKKMLEVVYAKWDYITQPLLSWKNFPAYVCYYTSNKSPSWNLKTSLTF